MRPFDIIKKKRDGGILSGEEIDFFIRGIVDGEIPDYQVSALLMAIYFNGMADDEIYQLTSSMMYSGKVISLSDIAGMKVDKHSTGGVGDKLTLTIAPLAASAGLHIPMISGRGLGHTGGTIDKLESIPGFKTNLSIKEFTRNIREINLSIICQTGEIAPADRKLYSLRDVTATVDSLPLIVSSIMSKKLAEGIDGLVLDVKTGSGAFLKKLEDSLALGDMLVRIGRRMGKRVAAIITDMNQPSGYAVGNSLEVVEAIEVLKGKGPEDIRFLTLNIAAWMLKMGDMAAEIGDGIRMLEDKLRSGEALQKFRELIKAQGGNMEVIENYNLLPHAKIVKEIKGEKAGYVQSIDTEKIGIAACMLGAGRLKVDLPIDHSAGLIVRKKIGDYVERGETLITIHTNNEDIITEVKSFILNSYVMGDKCCSRPPLIHKVLN